MRPNSDLVPQLAGKGWVPVAKIRPLSAIENGDSPWSIGLETIDRGYVDYTPLAPYIGEIGATQARIQAGWARCDPLANKDYNWGWLDEIVDGCLSQGVRPWLQASYGNPAYPGGGGIGLSEGLPSSDEALQAWDDWVANMVSRYCDRVDVWEVWNEPDLAGIPPEDYAAFYIRTAKIIRRVSPSARLVAIALCHVDESNYVGKFMQFVSAAECLHLIDEISFHFYPHNPDDTFASIRALQRLCARHDPRITFRQGETGAPSECSRILAMRDFDWCERKQAAWNMRRLLAHHARGIPMSLFQMADMHYEKKQGALHGGRNPKGQLLINPEKKVVYKKPAWFAAQHIFSVFNGSFPVKPATALDPRSMSTLSAWAWSRKGESGASIIGWWDAGSPPSMKTPDLGNCGMEPYHFRDPVLVDFMSGIVFAPPPGIAEGDPSVWNNLPVGDTPLALAERDVLPLQDL